MSSTFPAGKMMSFDYIGFPSLQGGVSPESMLKYSSAVSFYQ